MPDSRTARWNSWGLAEVRSLYPGLTLRPAVGSAFHLRGELRFAAVQGEHAVEDGFDLDIRVPPNFPNEVPTVKDIGGRIPGSYHTNPDGTLCLGSPLKLKIELASQPTLRGFVEGLLVPYLFNFAVGKTTGRLPLGELAHGSAGVVVDYQKILRARSKRECIGLLRLLSLRKRVANKLACPCGSGQRVGRCHNAVLNPLRTVATRGWFRQEWAALS